MPRCRFTRGTVAKGRVGRGTLRRPSQASSVGSVLARERQVMLDEELADLYGIETKRLVSPCCLGFFVAIAPSP